MEQKGTVMKTEGTRALVNVPRASACGEHCANCAGGCQSRGHQAWVENPVGAKKGDLVLLYATDSAVLRGVLLVYGLPLVLFFVTSVFVYSKTNNTLQTAFIGLLALVLAFWGLHRLDAVLASKPQITKILLTDTSSGTADCIKKENTNGI